MTGPIEQWLKRMIKGSPSSPKPQITPSGPVKKGKAASTSKIPVKKGTPSTTRVDSDLGSRLEAIRERRKTLEKKLASSPWDKGKGKGPGPVKGKGKSTREVGQLKPFPGWEDWSRGKKLRRRLDYDSDGKNEDPFQQEETHPQEKNHHPEKKRRPNEDGVWTFKNGWLKQVLNFIGRAISTWGPELIWPNDSRAEIPASIDWIRLPNNTTLITVIPRICKTRGKRCQGD